MHWLCLQRMESILLRRWWNPIPLLIKLWMVTWSHSLRLVYLLFPHLGQCTMWMFVKKIFVCYFQFFSRWVTTTSIYCSSTCEVETISTAKGEIHCYSRWLSESLHSQPLYQRVESPFRSICRSKDLELPSLPPLTPSQNGLVPEEDHFKDRSLKEVYFWWSLAGGDLHGEVQKKGLVKTRPAILNLPWYASILVYSYFVVSVCHSVFVLLLVWYLRRG